MIRRLRGAAAGSEGFSAASLFAARIAGALLTTVTQIAISRLCGAAVLGDYFLLIAALNILTMVMPLGFQSVGNYFAAEYAAGGEPGRIHAFAAKAYRHIAFVAVPMTALAISLAVFGAVRWPAVASLALPAVIMASAMAVAFVNSSLLIGLKRPVAGLLADAVLRPMAMIAGFLIAPWIAGNMLAGLMWVAAACYIGVVAVQTAMLKRQLRQLGGAGSTQPETARWWRYALPSATMALIVDFFFDIDMLLLGPLIPREELAVFGAAVRVFALLAFAVSAVQTVLMPDIVSAGANGDRTALRDRIGRANAISLAVASALTAIAIFSGPGFALLFGPSFAAAATPFTVLCLGLIVRCAAGPLTLILSIHERPAAGLPAGCLALAILAASNLVMVPAFGANGAALAALCATVLGTAALWLTAWRHTHVDVSILPSVRQMLGRPA
jgi:O-antigen/teichoic acid export membrane protein